MSQSVTPGFSRVVPSVPSRVPWKQHMARSARAVWTSMTDSSALQHALISQLRSAGTLES